MLDPRYYEMLPINLATVRMAVKTLRVSRTSGLHLKTVRVTMEREHRFLRYLDVQRRRRAAQDVLDRGARSSSESG